MNFRRYYAVEKWVTGRHKKGKKLKEQTRRRNKWLLRQRLGKYLDKHPEVDTILREMVPFTSNAEIKWFYAEDDELAMGILEALNGGGISDSTKEAIYVIKHVITECGGLNEYYEVLRGNSCERRVF